MSDLVTAKWSGVSDAEYALMLLSLPEKKRRWVMSDIGRAIRKQTRANINKQTSVTGKSFAERNRKRKLRGKMLSGFGREKNFFNKTTTEQVTVTWLGRMAGLARVHQEGRKFRSKTPKVSRAKLNEMRSMMALKWQARLMNRLGFKVANKDGNGKRGKAGVAKKSVSQDWIMENVTAFQAMIIIAQLRQERGESGSGESTEVVLPARHFFPNDQAWLFEIATQLLRKQYQKGR